MKHDSQNRQNIGEIGEELACRFLVKRGFRVIDRNYSKKWGEIDIIAKKEDILRFVEVKTVSRENIEDVTRETLEQDRPEENVHPWKVQRLHRAIQSYLGEGNVSQETPWQLDVVAVFLDLPNKQARIRFTENVVM